LSLPPGPDTILAYPAGGAPGPGLEPGL